MIDTVEAESARPVPRWLHVGVVAAVGVILFPLVLGQLVTTIRAGMADPLWPTTPWHLFLNFKLDLGYLVEHSHRIAGFVLGGLLGLLVLGIWHTEPRSAARWVGLVALLALLGAFGQFHGEVMAQFRDRDGNQIIPERFVFPVVPVAAMGASLAVLAALGIAGLASGVRGSGLRLFAVAVLVAVMVQGILGGLRVALNALVGPELAAVHGFFAQVVFCLVLLLAVFTARPPSSDVPSASGAVGRLSLVLVAVLLAQLALGVLVRHMPTPLTQRLHILTAFLAVGLVAWLLRSGFGDPKTHARIGSVGRVLAALVVVQLVLGVEAWMGKFSAEAWNGDATSALLTETQTPTPPQAAIRTAHVLVGTGVLGSAVVLAACLRRRRGPVVAAGQVHEARASVETARPEFAVATTAGEGEPE